MRTIIFAREEYMPFNRAKVLLYAEDAGGSEIIMDVPCRLLGEIKPGQQIACTFGDEIVKIFAVTENGESKKVSFSILPAGSENLSVCGYVSEGAEGKEFVFKGATSTKNANSAVIKRILFRILIPFAVAMTIIIVSGIINTVKGGIEKVFTYEEMSITLNSNFKELKESENEIKLESDDIIVWIMREDIDDNILFEFMSTKEYADVSIEANGLIGASIVQESDPLYIEYETLGTDNKTPLYYRIYVYKSNDAFWTVQFVTMEKDKEKLDDKIEEYVKTVVFAEE